MLAQGLVDQATHDRGHALAVEARDRWPEERAYIAPYFVDYFKVVPVEPAVR